MLAEDCLRLAWEADRQGRRKFRDSLLTMAVVESGPADWWADRCRSRLAADRPGHYLAGYPSVRVALADPRVIDARDRLRAKYPVAKVLGLLHIARASRGPFTGRPDSLDAILEDLVGPPAEADNVRRDAAQSARGPLVSRVRSGQPIPSGMAYAGISGRDEAGEWTASEAEDEPDLDRFYQTILFAVAVLRQFPVSEAGGRPSSARDDGGCRG